MAPHQTYSKSRVPDVLAKALKLDPEKLNGRTGTNDHAKPNPDQAEEPKPNGDQHANGDTGPDSGSKPPPDTGAGAKEKPTPKIRLIPAAQFREAKPPLREWYVEGLIPMNTVTLLSGDGGTGKSLLSLQLSAHRGSWLNREVRPGKTVFLTAEDDEDELHRRVHTIALNDGDGNPNDQSNLSLTSLAGECALLAIMAKDGTLMPSPLFYELEVMVDHEKPVLLVLDTAADLYPGNENDRAQVRQFIGMLRGLAIRHRLAIVLLYHPSVAGMQSGSGTSGSTAWNNSCRSRLYLQRVVEKGEGTDYEPDPDARKLEVKKANYARKGEEILMRWQDGVFVSVDAGTTTDESAENREARAEDTFLRLLRRYTAENRPVNAKSGSSYAPKVFAEDSDRCGLRKDDFKGAMNRLLRGKRIKNETYGPPSHERTRLVPVC